VLKKICIGLVVLLAIAVGVAFWLDIPRFVIGLATYGRQAREGTLAVGDPAPSVTLHELDGATAQPLESHIGSRPLVLIFGSFT